MLTGRFPAYARDTVVTLPRVHDLTVTGLVLREFLSEESKKAYFWHQDELHKVLAVLEEEVTKIQGAESERGLCPTYGEHLPKVGSDLRTTLVRDVGTRHDAKLKMRS